MDRQIDKWISILPNWVQKYKRQFRVRVIHILDRFIHRKIDRQIGRKIERQIDRQAERQKDRKAERQKDRWIDRMVSNHPNLGSEKQEIIQGKNYILDRQIVI